MPTSKATLPPTRRIRDGLIALLLALAPVPLIAAAAPGELKRADTLDMRRAGKVSEDERAVLRIEWRAGLSGIDADRELGDILSRLRRVETTMVTVNRLVRDMPSKGATTAVAVGEAAEEGLDWRLMAANLTALVLVIVWWAGRRKTQLAAAALEAELAAKMRAGRKAEAPAEPELKFLASQPADEVARAMTSALPLSATSAGPEVQTGAVSASSTSPDRAPDSASLAHPPATPMARESAAAGVTALTVDFVLEEAEAPAAVPAKRRSTSGAIDATAPASTAGPVNKHADPTLQLAEIMLSMGLEQGAAEALMEYTEANPRDAIYHMLKLLGIYRKRGQRTEFQETAEKLRKNFNIQAEDWTQAENAETPTLERFSRVSQHVQSIWQDPQECLGYLRRLLEDNRDGARAGFPQSVAEEILLLVEILKETSGNRQKAA